MSEDKRLNWEYRECKINPVHCYCSWGQCATPIDFGNAYRTRYWLINFPDDTWIHCGTKAECREYIDSDRCRRHLKEKVKCHKFPLNFQSH